MEQEIPFCHDFLSRNYKLGCHNLNFLSCDLLYFLRMGIRLDSINSQNYEIKSIIMTSVKL